MGILRDHPRRKRWLWILGTVGALFALVLVLLPVGIRWGAKRALERWGHVSARIEDVDFNPFTGNLVVRAFGTRKEGQERLDMASVRVRVDWSPLWHRRVWVESFSLEDATLDVHRDERGLLTVGGVTLEASGGDPTAPAPSGDVAPWGFGIGGVDLREVRIRYADPMVAADAIVHRLHLDPLATWEPDASTRFRLDLELNGGRVALEGEARPFAAERTLSAHVDVRALALGWLAQLLHAHGVDDLAGTLETALNLDARVADKEMRGSVGGSLALTGVVLSVPTARLENLDLRWDGKAEARLGPEEAVEATLEGELGLADPKASLTDPDLRVSGRSLTWRGSAAYRTAGETPDFGLRGNLSAADLAADGPLEGRRLLEVAQLTLVGLELDGPGSVAAASFTANGVRALERRQEEGAPEKEAADIVALKEVTLEGIRAMQQPLAARVESVRLSGLSAWLARDGEGRMEWAEWLPPSGMEPAKTGEPRPLPRLRVGRIEVGGDSRVVFTDASVKPRAQTEASSLELAVSALDTATPEGQSPVTLRAELGRYAKAAADGWVSPFAQPPSLDLAVKVADLDLPPLTGYPERNLGYRIKSGHLDTEVKAAVDRGVVDADVQVALNKFVLEALRPDQKDAFTEELGLPVSSALNLLRDRNDDIRLTIPVEGDLSSPEFGIGDAVRKAVAKGALAAVKTAAVVAFAPLGVAMAAGKLFSLATALRFDPVTYPPGETAPDAPGREYLDKVGKVMRERPGVRLQLCGWSTDADRKALAQAEQARRAAAPAPATPPPPVPAPAGGSAAPGAETPPPQPAPAAPAATAPPPPPEIPKERLLELAGARSDSAKEYLIGRGVEQGRLFLCSPDVDPEPDGAPRVDVAL